MATYRFFPPVEEENLPVLGQHEPGFSLNNFLRRLRWPRGISVVRSGDGFVNQRHVVPRSNWVEGRDYFVGGFHYSGIPEEIATQLFSSGYEPEEE